jgi:hypothetical protein
MLQAKRNHHLQRQNALAGFQGGLEDQRCIPGEATEFFRNQDDGISPERGDSPASRGRKQKHRPQGESLLTTEARDVSGKPQRGLGVRADGGSAGSNSNKLFWLNCLKMEKFVKNLFQQTS